MNRTIELPKFDRAVEFRAQTFDEEKRTVDLVWTTGAVVRRMSWEGPYDEELVVNAKTVRLARLNSNAPFLNSHAAYSLEGMIGSVVPGSARIEKGLGVATVQLSRRDDVAGIVQDIRDGIIRNVSVGYVIHNVNKQVRDAGRVPLWEIVDWEPMEISAVPIPADAGATMRSDEQRQLYPCVISTPSFVSAARMRMAESEMGFKKKA